MKHGWMQEKQLNLVLLILDIEIPNVSMLYQEATVQNSMMNKIKETFKNVDEEKIKADSLINRLDLIKNWR